jgi:hypothetical protein
MMSVVTQFHLLANTVGATFLAGVITKAQELFTKSFIIASEHGDGLLRL